MNKEQISILNSACDKWGKNTQVMLALEEMAELSKELLKNINRKENNEIQIKEEIGDVYIMLEELKIIYNISHFEILEVITKKVERLKKRLSE